MAATFESMGSWSASTSNPAPAYPTSIAAGDLLLLIVGTKPETATSTRPTGWKALVSGTGGAGSAGIDTGPMLVEVFARIADGTESGTVTVTNGANSVSGAAIVRISKAAGEVWDLTATVGADSTAGAAISATGGTLGWAANDLILTAFISSTDNATHASHGISASGITFGTHTERGSELASSSGNDIGGVVATTTVSSGSGNAAPTYTATASGTTTNVAGVVAFVRVRAEAPVDTVESFDLSDGTTITTSNTALDAITGTGTIVADDARAISGSAALVTTSSGLLQANVDMPANSMAAAISVYMQLDTLSATNLVLLEARNAASGIIAQVRKMGTGGTINIRNGTVSVATTTLTVAADEWFRLDWRVNPAQGQELRVFRGADLHAAADAADSTGTIETLTGAAVGDATIGPDVARFLLPVNTSSTETVWVDELRARNDYVRLGPMTIVAGSAAVTLPALTADATGVVSTEGTFAATGVGTATAAGDAASFTGQAVFAATTVGTATASGEVGSLAAASPATFATLLGDATASGATGSLTGAGSFAATGQGTGTASGEVGSLRGAGTFATLVGAGTADGAAGSFAVPATFTTLAGTATADGQPATFTGGAAFSTTATAATASGTSASLTGGATFATTTGAGAASGAAGALLGAAQFASTAGDATADGGVGVLFGGTEVPATFATLVGTATASGEAGSLTAPAIFATLAGAATATGEVGSLRGAATFTTAEGSATAVGGIGSLVNTAPASFTTLAGDATASGAGSDLLGAAQFTTLAGTAAATGVPAEFIGGQPATFATLTGSAAASGRRAALLGVRYHRPADGTAERHTGTTARPSSGTTARPTGTTTRPYAGTTPRGVH